MSNSAEAPASGTTTPQHTHPVELNVSGVGPILQADWMRWVFFLLILIPFAGLNVFVGWTTWFLVTADEAQFDRLLALAEKNPEACDALTTYSRVVTSKVVMSLIAGTVLQTGAAVICIGKALFGRTGVTE